MKTLKVGITGGIGSGKTTVCKIFEVLNIPVYYSDERAKWLMNNNLTLKNEICDLFSSDAYFENGELNRSFLAKIIFEDDTKRTLLNNLIHPKVMEDGENWFKTIDGKFSYALKESAILFESGAYLWADKVITVSAFEKIRINRVQKRDFADLHSVIRRILSQWSDEQREAKSDFVIQNNGTQLLIPQIIDIHKMLI